MKIGILLKNLDALANWELRIIDEIRESPNFDLELLIFDVSISHTEKARELSSYLPKNIIATFLFNILWLVERKVVVKKKTTVNKESISEYIKEVPSIEIDLTTKDFGNDLNKKKAEFLKEHNLDVIVSLGFSGINRKLTNFSKNGIWSLRHGTDHIHDENPIGFHEIIKEEAHVEVSLNQLVPETDEHIRLDKRYFNRHWSLVKTNDMVLESSVSVLMKNLNQLESGKLSLTKISSVLIPSNNGPTISQILRYKFRFYLQLTTKLKQRIANKFFGVRYYCFTLFLGEGEFLNTDRSELKPVELPKNELWADPFLFRYNDEVYVFFESCPYDTKRGKICCGKLQNGNIIEVIDVLDLDYHISYPYIFEEKGDIYLMPESSDNKNLTIYKCLEFPHKWELFTTAFEDEIVGDAFFHDDKSGQKWLFVNKASATSVPLENELHIYKVDSLKLLNQSVPHKQNPVLIDSRKARNGGAIFEYKDELYRPSQCCDKGLYGRALNINKIKILSLDEYVEETVEIVEPDFHEGLLATHHLHQIDGLFVIDGAHKKL